MNIQILNIVSQYKTKIMTKANNTKTLLTDSDPKLIAESLGINYDTVNKIKKGTRGKRKTEVQQKVERAIEFRTRQNENLIKFCNQMKVESVTPKASK